MVTLNPLREGNRGGGLNESLSSPRTERGREREKANRFQERKKTSDVKFEGKLIALGVNSHAKGTRVHGERTLGSLIGDSSIILRKEEMTKLEE